MQAPPPAPAVRNPDDEHLKLLSAFHWVVCGFSVLGLLFLILHYTLMQTILLNPKTWEKSRETPPAEFITVMLVMYGVMTVILIAYAIANALSARYLRQRKHRGFSLVVAGANCLQIPIGTTLGVFTFIVLLRPSVAYSYARVRETSG